VNGGFGLVLDGTEEAAQKAALMLGWDVSNGVARRSVHLPTFLRRHLGSSPRSTEISLY
jgi:hypothetical protein